MKLSATILQARLKTLPKWNLQDGKKISRHYEFSDFSQAWGFMSRVALKAEQLNHHPNWSNVYNTIQVELWTHDHDGITDLDFQLASFMDSLEH